MQKSQRRILLKIGLLFCIVVLVIPIAVAEETKTIDDNLKHGLYDTILDSMVIQQSPYKISLDSIIKDTNAEVEKIKQNRNSLDDPLVRIYLFDVLASPYGYCVEYLIHNYESYTVDITLVTVLRLPNGQIYGGNPYPITLQADDDYGMSFIAQYGSNGPYGQYSFSIHIFDALTGNLLDQRTITWIHDNPIYRRYYPEQVYS